MSIFKRAIAAIVGSKKLMAMLAGVLLTLLSPLASKIGLELTTEHLLSVLGLLASYIVGQGIADAGKEKAKIEALSKTTRVTRPIKVEP